MLTPPDSQMIASQSSSGVITPPNGKPQTIAIASSKYTEENEIHTKTILTENTIAKNLCESPTATDLNDAQEYGKLGSLVFKLRFLTDRNALVVSVIRCRGLPNKTSSGEIPTGMNGKIQTATDPYVKLQLLPEKQHKVKTRYVHWYCLSLFIFFFLQMFQKSKPTPLRNGFARAMVFQLPINKLTIF